jgi:hypothetical protein
MDRQINLAITSSDSFVKDTFGERNTSDLKFAFEAAKQVWLFGVDLQTEQDSLMNAHANFR